MLEVDLGDARTGREDERLRELLLADGAEHGHERVAAVGVEGAAEVGDVGPGEASQHPVDEPRGQRPPPRVVTAQATAARDVGARLDGRDQPGEVGRRVLEIGVHRDDDVTACPNEPGVHRRVLAEVPLEAYCADAGVGAVQRSTIAHVRSVRSVVDDDQLVGPAEGLEGRRRSAGTTSSSVPASL